jgi:hypothetical protein
MLLRRSRSTSRGWRACAAGLVGLAAVAGAEPVATPEWQSALEAYVHDPRANGDRLIALARRGTAGVPPVFVLAAADASMRRGRLGRARALFGQLAGPDAGLPWSAWANLGLGGIALRTGDRETARAHYERVVAVGGELGAFAELTVAIADTTTGNVAGALPVFERLAETASPVLGTAAQMWAGYARFWLGDQGGALRHFTAVGARDPNGRIADDARYAAAWTRLQLDDDARARAELAVLARETHDGARRISRPLLALDRDALLRSVWPRYRQAPPGPPENQALGALDADGAAFARAALRMLDAPDGDTAARAAAEPGEGPAGAPRVAAAPQTTGPQPAQPQRGATPAAPERRGYTIPLVLVVALGAAWMLWRSRNRQGLSR